MRTSPKLVRRWKSPRDRLLEPYSVRSGIAMTHIEKMRLQAALKALPGAHPDRAQRLPSRTERSAARGLCAEEARVAAAGTE